MIKRRWSDIMSSWDFQATQLLSHLYGIYCGANFYGFPPSLQILHFFLLDTVGKYSLGKQIASVINLIDSYQCRKHACLRKCLERTNCYLAVFQSTNGVGLCQLFTYLALNNLVNTPGYDVFRQSL
jgi:hypothetical protein